MIQWTLFRADWQSYVRRAQRPESDVARNMWCQENLTESDASDLSDAGDAARSSGGAGSRGGLDALVHRASRRYRAEAERAVEDELDDMLETEILPRGASIETPGLDGDNDGGANEAEPGGAPNRGGRARRRSARPPRRARGLPCAQTNFSRLPHGTAPPPRDTLR